MQAGESVLIGLVTTAVVMVPLLGAPISHFSTMTHEGAHALLAVILGLTVTEIILDRHFGGKTSITGEGLRVVLVLIIGYLGPSLFGLGAARLISLGDPVAVLWLLVLLVLLLFLLGRSFGMLSVPVTIALVYLILRYTHAGTEVVAAYAAAWLLLLCGVRHASTERAGLARRGIRAGGPGPGRPASAPGGQGQDARRPRHARPVRPASLAGPAVPGWLSGAARIRAGAPPGNDSNVTFMSLWQQRCHIAVVWADPGGSPGCRHAYS